MTCKEKKESTAKEPQKQDLETRRFGGKYYEEQLC